MEENDDEDDFYEEMSFHMDPRFHEPSFLHGPRMEIPSQFGGGPVNGDPQFISLDYGHCPGDFSLAGPVVHEGFVPRIDDEYSHEDEEEEPLRFSPTPVTPSYQIGQALDETPSNVGGEVSGSDDQFTESDSDEAFTTIDEHRTVGLILDASTEVADPDFTPWEDGRSISPDDMSSRDGSTSEDGTLRGEGRRGPSRGRGRSRGRARGPVRRRGWRAVLRGLETPSPARARGRALRGEGYRGGRRGRRGPRAAAEPSREFKQLQTKATEAFLSKNDPAEALEFARQAVQINPEIFAAHSLLSEILLSMGRNEDSVGALLSGAHTRRDPKLWWHVADRTMELCGKDKEAVLGQAYYCYTQIIRLDPRDYDARAERLKIHLELNYHGRARKECEAMLKIRPHDMHTLRQLAELSTTNDEASRAKQLYEQSIEHLTNGNDEEQKQFTWSSLNIFLELLDGLGDHADATFKLRKLARWLLGRQEEVFWDEQEDDREWDAEDEPRRTQIQDFIPGRHLRDSYGKGLPLELRVKLGLFRLKLGDAHLAEALYHFDFLDPDDSTTNAKVLDYDDLFRDVADNLKKLGYFKEALRFYEPLRGLPNAPRASCYLSMAECYRELRSTKEAEALYRSIIDNDAGNIEARLRLAKLYEELGMTVAAQSLVTEVMNLGRRDLLKKANLRLREPERDDAKGGNDATGPAVVRRPPQAMGKPRKITTPTERIKQDISSLREHALRAMVAQLQSNQSCLDEGGPDAVRKWTDAARFLVDIIRREKAFGPVRDRSLRPEPVVEDHEDDQAVMARLRAIVEACAPDLEQHVELNLDHTQPAGVEGFAGLSFGRWLDMICRYSLLLAEKRQSDSCWQVLLLASESNVFLQDDDLMHQLQACWIGCALRLGDDQHLNSGLRWFMRKYPFAGEPFELLNTISSIISGSHSWYSAGPNQKFVLRQVRIVEGTLLCPQRPTDADTGIISHGVAELNPAAIATYGHILSMSGSYPNALYYYFRVYALQPDDPMINLSIAIAYVQQALKRQAENRQNQIQQGLAFMLRYHKLRTSDGVALHSQEAEFNVGRMWHLLGLMHLALQSYERCLQLSERVLMETERDQEKTHEEGGGKGYDIKYDNGRAQDLAPEAAFAMQTIYALDGDMVAARRITEQWLEL